MTTDGLVQPIVSSVPNRSDPRRAGSRSASNGVRKRSAPCNLPAIVRESVVGCLANTTTVR